MRVLGNAYLSHAQGRVICVPTQSSANEEIANKSNTTTTAPYERTSGESKNMFNTETYHDDTAGANDKKGVDTNQSVAKHDVFPSTDTDFSLFLRCSLNVWCAVNHDANSIHDALCDLLQSATQLCEERWLVSAVL